MLKLSYAPVFTQEFDRPLKRRYNDCAQSKPKMISNRGSNGDFLENNPLLTRIAQALEISQAAFYGPTGSDLEQTAELLRLWQTITDGHDREKLLTVARKFAPRA